MRRQPMRGETGRRLAGALQRGPSEKLTRVSPGVYQNAKGQLTGPGGRPQQNMGRRIAQDVQDGAASEPPMPQVQPPVMEQEFVQYPAQMPMDKMFRYPMPQNFFQMPEPSANMGGQYRLSPGVYGTREQAMQQYNQQFNQPYMPGPANPQEQMQPPAMTPYPAWMQRKG